jgi:hypothetical protein
VTARELSIEDMIHAATRASECDWRWGAETIEGMPLVKMTATFADGTTRTRTIRRAADADEIQRAARSARASWLHGRLMELGR